MSRKFQVVVAAGLATSLLILGGSQAMSKPPAEPVLSPLDTSTFDRSADPCTDFYQYVCGGWMAKTGEPTDRNYVALAEEAASAQNRAAMTALLTDRSLAKDPEVDRLQVFYASCMAGGDQADRLAQASLQGWLGRIDGVETRADFATVLQSLHARGVRAFFRYSGEPDPADKSRFRGEIHQGAFGLPRGTYRDDGAEAAAVIASYRGHVAAMLASSGVERGEANRQAERIVAMEKAMARVSLSFAERFDPSISNNPIDPAALARNYPNFAWADYLKAVGQPAGRPMNVTSPKYLKAVNDGLAQWSMRDLKAYLRWRLLDTVTPALPGAMREEQARFAAAYLDEPRASRADECEVETIKGMGVELSRQYSTRFIGVQARGGAKTIVHQVRGQIADSVDGMTWLSPSARAATRKKIDALSIKVGFPDAWPATGADPMSATNFFDNVMATRGFQEKRAWARVNEPRTRESWEIMVYPDVAPGLAVARLTVPNGYPDVFTNSIILTAAGLTPPRYDEDASPELRMGGYGALVGHEVTHVLENHDYDAEGEGHDIWTAADASAHDQRAQCLIKQANEVDLGGGARLNGERTFSENVADLGGVNFAYDALVRALGPRMGQRDKAGFTRAQRFFIAYAQSRCTVQREAYARLDNHAPASFRVNGPLANMPAFAKAFACRKGSAMVRPAERRCVVW
ncbi:M13 family metallopeptidase [Caulobacter sp. 17J65-9]|uniref:M13-type metalloendopeptidase n=1 Tax=Caulobacter sp. 17J65-9 TaxID=2709382 RepID=UPI0013CC1698|nr:M13 family metallopeptidase [Caulobacter sp. 17J65-9]